ncbi:MAG: cation:proton antiporter, partial [Candidatus Binataceae bacterium]
EWIGVHAIFGSFLVGIAIGDSSHLREQTRKTIGQFVSFSFAPIFFASLGLKVNYYTHLDLRLTVIVLLIACVGKVLGCGLAARAAGMTPREAWGVGMAMNARGAMEIILGVIALQHGLIDERVFVALVIMAIVTSMLSGPALTRLLHLKRQRRIEDFMVPKSLVPNLKAHDHRAAIRELGAVAAELAGLNIRNVQSAVLEREELMPTGLGNRVAVPHARIHGLPAPIVVLGLSSDGVDFDAPDGEPAQLIFLLLTPREDGAAQVSLLADVAGRFGTEEARKAALRAASFTELLAILRTQ